MILTFRSALVLWITRVLFRVSMTDWLVAPEVRLTVARWNLTTWIMTRPRVGFVSHGPVKNSATNRTNRHEWTLTVLFVRIRAIGGTQPKERRARKVRPGCLGNWWNTELRGWPPARCLSVRGWYDYQKGLFRRSRCLRKSRELDSSWEKSSRSIRHRNS